MYMQFAGREQEVIIPGMFVTAYRWSLGRLF